jgi:chromosome segregation ATPase
MTATLQDLERRVEALEQARPADLRTAVTTIAIHVEDTRLRLTRVEARLDTLTEAMAHLTASTAELRSRIDKLDSRMDKLESRMDKLESRMDKLDSRMDQLDANFTAFQRGLPALIADTMREVLREQKGDRS